MPGPLDGYRVVEISEGVAGPYTAMSLGDAGADVIKIESPAGDRSRGWSPAVGDNSAAWHALNRSKRGIVLDWSNPADLDTARRLLRQADVAVVDKVGLPPELAWDALGADQLVYCAISGWGPNGPWSERAAGELAAQLASEATASLGSIGEPPVRLGNDAGSMYAANYAIQGVCAALYARDVSARGGQRLEVSLFGSLLAMRSTLWVALSNPDEWWGFHLDSYIKPPDHGYQCADLPIYFSKARMGRDALEGLIDQLDMAWVRNDPQFGLLLRDGAGGAGRWSHELKHLWERGFANWTAAEVIEESRAQRRLGIPNARLPTPRRRPPGRRRRRHRQRRRPPPGRPPMGLRVHPHHHPPPRPHPRPTHPHHPRRIGVASDAYDCGKSAHVARGREARHEMAEAATR